MFKELFRKPSQLESQSVNSRKARAVPFSHRFAYATSFALGLIGLSGGAAAEASRPSPAPVSVPIEAPQVPVDGATLLRGAAVAENLDQVNAITSAVADQVLQAFPKN